MKIDTIQPQVNLKSFFDFAKLDLAKKTELLTTKGTFLDLDSEKNTLTKLYFLNGFFVEEVICRKLNKTVDVIPFKQGYRIENYIQLKTFSTSGSNPFNRSISLN
jgi:hypothetical protein